MPTLLNDFLRRLREAHRPHDPAVNVAAELGVSSGYLSKVETGMLKIPSEDVIEQIPRVYKLAASTKTALNSLYEAAKKGTLPSNDPEGQGAILTFASTIALDFPVRYYLVDGLATMLAKKPAPLSIKDEAVIDRRAIYQYVFAEDRKRALLQTLYDELLSPRRQFFIEEHDDPGAEPFKHSCMSIGDLCVVEPISPVYSVTADLSTLQSFDETYRETRQTAMSGEEAVKFVASVLDAHQQHVNNLKRINKWSVEQFRNKIVVKPPKERG